MPIDLEWEQPTPQYPDDVEPETFLTVPPIVYAYARSGQETNIKLPDHVKGYPPPRVARATGVPDYAQFVGTTVYFRPPMDTEAEKVTMKVEMEN